jgi:hypothetical protein
MLLTSTHRLDNGMRVRLRYPYTRDHRAVADLHARLGLPVDELEARRLVTFDLRRRLVVCAVGWIDGHEQLLGIAATARDGASAPELLVADEASAPGVGALLAEALAEQARLRVA